MPYIYITSFKGGLDSRRSPITTTQGSMLIAKNGHITRGGEFEKRKAFVPRYDLPDGTFGMHAASGRLYVFGSKAVGDLPSAIPNGVTYQRLVSPTGSAMVDVVSSESFNGLPYVVARYNDGNVYRFYNGTRSIEWDNIAPVVTSMATLGTSLASLVDSDQDVSAVYTLVGTAHIITITGSANNDDYAISASVLNGGTVNDSTISAIVTQPATVSQPKIVQVQIGGTYEPADRWTITIKSREYTITGAASGTGGESLTYRGKLYTILQSLLYFSDVNDPMNMSTDGAGFINISNQTGGSDMLTALAPYQSFLAVMSRNATQIWSVDPDPALNKIVQIINNVGTMAPRSAVGFGESDVFFLSDSGIRSLRARDASNAAVTYDVGTSIDTLVTKQIQATNETLVTRACGVIEPVDGRYLLAIGNTVFVYSQFQASSISAWSTYDLGFNVDWFTTMNSLMYARGGNRIYLYGGVTGNEYDNSEVVVHLACLDASKPPEWKSWTALDMMADGLWKIEANFEPKTSVFDLLGYVTDQNVSLPNFPVSGGGTHISLRFTHNSAEYARLSAAIVHFTSGSSG